MELQCSIYMTHVIHENDYHIICRVLLLEGGSHVPFWPPYTEDCQKGQDRRDKKLKVFERVILMKWLSIFLLLKNVRLFDFFFLFLSPISRPFMQ